MKIIKPGRAQNGWAKECECTGAGNGNGGCGAILLVEERDLYKTYHHCKDETDTFITFKCSACGVETDIKDVPYNIRNTLPSQEAWDKSHIRTCVYRFENGQRCSVPVRLSNYCYEHRLKCGNYDRS